MSNGRPAETITLQIAECRVNHASLLWLSPDQMRPWSPAILLPFLQTSVKAAKRSGSVFFFFLPFASVRWLVLSHGVAVWRRGTLRPGAGPQDSRRRLGVQSGEGQKRRDMD